MPRKKSGASPVKGRNNPERKAIRSGEANSRRVADGGKATGKSAFGKSSDTTRGKAKASAQTSRGVSGKASPKTGTKYGVGKDVKAKSPSKKPMATKTGGGRTQRRTGAAVGGQGMTGGGSPSGRKMFKKGY